MMASLSCQTKVESQQITPPPVANKSPISDTSSTAASTPEPKVNSEIRKFDFKNFTFPWTKEQGAPDLFTLKGGEKESVGDESGASLGNIEYGDVTNDHQEEAMISIYPITGGNCSCHMVYIYTLRNKMPKLLWSFDTWDRAEGGFKRAYSEKGELVVELFGDDRFENGEWQFDIAEGKFNGLCCPTTFTRIQFHWDGKKFVPTGKREVFDYDWRKQRNGKD